ncbi:Chromosome partition protein Smc [Streptococcus infantarius subsp. infantarius]|nr:Chromosome partition protein Smc [Streptococcus infantarius subsp. infantarius]MCO4688459.1 Chromosome partition protein Smc [Streptococcus infantarius subsp. infantarius]
MENVRIAIRDSTDSHNVAFFDNISGIRYQSANLQRFLAGSASILTIEYNSKDIDTIRTGCKLAFIYKERAYWLNIMDLSKKGYKVEITAYSIGLELNQEERGAHKPANAMNFAEYLGYYDPEHALEIGVNEVADKRIKLEWTGTDTILARLFSIANSFDAELEFTVELNQDYSLKRQVLNVYKKGNLGSNRAVSPVRVGRGLKVINYSDNLKELRTAVRATGKDGLTLDGLNKKVYDDDGNLLYYSNANTVYAPQSRDKYPSVGKKSNDNWIIKELGETEYSTQEDLWGYMLRELKKICVPEITYDIEGAVDGDVGDTRTLIDDVHYDPPLYVQARISELTEDLITGKVTKSTLTNFERKYSQVASELLKQVEQLANDAAPYIIRLETNNGFNFKNGKGSSTVTASLEKYGKIVGASWKWLINNSVVSETSSVTINASQVTGTLNVVAVASVDGNEVAREYITFTNSDDGVGIKSIKRYYTTNDQSEGVTTGGQNWSTKPTTVTADKNYMWSYDVITYTNDTSLVTEPAVIGARGDDGLDADTTGITEALDKAKQELTALSANIEKVRDDSLAAVEEAKQQLAAVANDLSKAKTDLQNAVSAVDTKATNLQSDLTTAKQDLQAQASQLTEQASAQSELTKRVSSVEETANGTKTTVSELSKTVDSNTKNITSITARTKVVEDDLTSTKTTLSQVQTTANSASQKTATLETGLNGLGAKFENLQIGTVNLLHNSKGPFKPNANKVDNWQRFEDTYVYLENGKQYVLSGETDGNFTSIHDSFKESDNVVLWLVNPNTSFNKIMSDGKTGTTGTVFTWNSASGTYQLRVNTYRTVSTKSAWNIQIEEGNLRSTYSQNESDIESKVAEYKQTADQNYASLSSTVQTLDGQVQSNKTTAEQTAQGFSTRIESLETYKDGETTRANQYFELAKTETARQLTAERTAIAKDYVAKSTYTSDVTGIRNDLIATTTTANTTKTNLANYQASNDKAVANLQSNMQTANGNISSLQTKIEAVPGQITSAVSAVESKIPTEIGSSNLLRNTAVNAENLKLFGKTDTTVSVVEKDGHQVYKLVVSGSSNAGAFFTSNIDYYNLIKDRNYTFSFWVLTNKDKNYNMYSLGHIQAVNTNGDNVGNDILHQHTQPVYSTNVIKANTWTKIWCTFKATSNSFFRPYFWYLTAGDEIYIYDMMLNEGKIPLSYTPAVEDTVSQISTLNTTLTQTAEGLTQLSTKVDTQGSTITSHTNSINSLSTGLSAKVSQTDFNTLSSRVTTAENNITATANELSSKITSVEGKIPTSIGGTNLVRGTANFSSGWTWNTKVATVTDIIDDFNVYHSTSTGTNTASNNYDIRFDNALTVLPGTEYTLSFWAKGSGTIYSHFFPSCVAHGVNSDGKTTTAADGSITHTLKSDWELYWVTWKTLPTVSGLKSLIPCRQPAFFKSEVWLYGVKLERGSVPTDWSPAPEDYDSKLAAAQSEIKQTTDSITASVSSVQTAASNAQSTANTAVSKADAAQAGVNTLDSTTVKTASLNLDNNGFVTKVGKTVNGNTFATMIAQNESDVQIIAKKMKVSGDMIVNGAITAEKLNINSLSALSAKLGDVTSGSITNAFSSGTRSGSIKIKDNVEITSTDTSNLLPEKAKENLVLSVGSLAMNASTSSDEATHSMLIMPETIKYTKNNYDTTRGGTSGWRLTHNGYYSMLQVDMVWQNVRINNTSNMPYGTKANFVRIGNLVTISVNRQITNVNVVAENKLAIETIPKGFRPITQAHLTLTGNTGSTIDATCICHLNPDGSIYFTNNKTGNRVWTGTVTYTCVEPMPYVKDLNNGSTI